MSNDDDGDRKYGNGADREHAVLADMLVAASAMIATIGESIQAAGPNGIASGHLYASVAGSMSVHTYQRVISLLIHMECVAQRGHVLTWIGPPHPTRTSDR